MKRTRLRRVSPKQRKRLADYSVEANKYFQDNPYCEICGAEAGQIHHKAGRGIRTADPRYFMSVCYSCHDEIGRKGKKAFDLGWRVDPDKEARENGYIV